MPKRKKIVFAINKLSMGGAENMLAEQVRCINKNLFEPYIVTVLPNPRVNILSRLPQDVRYIAFNFSNVFDVFNFYKLWSFLRREKVDAIVTGLFDANFICRIAAILARVPIIISYEHNIYGDKKKWQIISDRLLSHFTKKILVGSNDVLEFTSKQEHISKNKFQLNFNSIPLKLGKIKQNRNAILLKYGLPENLLYIVTAGSLTEQKGHTYLIDAVYELKQQKEKNFKVLIFGKGVLKDNLLKKIQRLNLSEEIKMMDVAPIEDIMAISDIFTMPSLWEGLSIALLNAMDAGCPIVATKVSGTKEAIENNVNGLLVEPKDPSGLSKALRSLLSNADLRKKFSNKATEDVKKFSIEKNVKVIENLVLSR